MKNSIFRAPVFALTTVLAAMTMGATHAADSGRSTQIIVPYSAGGTTDRIARIVAHGLSQELGTMHPARWDFSCRM